MTAHKQLCTKRKRWINKYLLFILLFTIYPMYSLGQIDSWYVNLTAEGKFNTDNGRWNYATLAEYGVTVKLWKGSHFVVDAFSNYMPHPSDYLSTDPLVFSNLDVSSG